MHPVTIQPFKDESSILQSKFLKVESLQVRDYQVEIAQKCVGKNYLVSIPTGCTTMTELEEK